MKKVLIGSIIAIIVFYFGLGIYKQLNSSCNSKRLPCQKEVVVFEKVYNENMLEKVQKMIASNKYDLTVHAQKSIYMETKLFESLDLEKVKECALKTLAQYKKDVHVEEEKALHVDFLVYENDKLDPGKKTPKSKLYAGYIVLGFSLANELVYKVQVDFMEQKGEDISRRVECAIKSLMTYNGEK